MKFAIENFNKEKQSNKYLILGDMLELGKFSKKLQLNFPLISDPECTLVKALSCWVEKTMYGKKYIGVDRSTFLINSKGLVVKEWRSVKVKGHVMEVLQALKEI